MCHTTKDTQLKRRNKENGNRKRIGRPRDLQKKDGGAGSCKEAWQTIRLLRRDHWVQPRAVEAWQPGAETHPAGAERMRPVVYNPMGRGERAFRQRQLADWVLARDAAATSAGSDTGGSRANGKPHSERHAAVQKAKPTSSTIDRKPPRMHRANRQRARGRQHVGVR